MRAVTLPALAFLLAAGAAQAADFDNERFSMSGFSWTGAYVGGSYTAAKVEDQDPAFPIGNGVTIPLRSEGTNDNWGVHVGYLHQLGLFVVGAEYEYNNLDIQFIGDGIGPIPVFVEEAHTLRARAGVAVDRFLFYGDAGYTHTSVNIGLADWTPSLGAGIDYAVTNNIVAGFHYDHSWYDEFDGMPISGTMDRISFRLGIKF
jgi:outer membrane immunogenic protein